MANWQIGEVLITKVLEQECQWPFKAILPDAADVADGVAWLKPDFLTDDGRMKLSIHALVIESEGMTIVVDPCVGNDKSRPGSPVFENLSTSFLDDFDAAGFDPETVDLVVCTHLHVDHVGWNTRLVDGEWEPTFPNARYLFVETEYNFWRDEPQSYGPVYEDSIRPIVDAGLSQLVEPDHHITGEIWLESTPGHTPGHVSIRIISGGEEGVITGDLTHHPVQLAYPEICSSADWNQEMGKVSRLAALERWSDGRLVIGTHFAGRTAGKIVADGDAYRLTEEN